MLDETRPAALLGEILPPAVVWSEAFSHDAVVPLFPAEEAAIARAVRKRRREFTAVRAHARAALARLGLPPVPIVPGARGEPGWPEGIVGSMTHCDGYGAAAVARAGDFVTVGIDAEPHAPLPDGILDSVSRPEEVAWLSELAAHTPNLCWDRLLFCAKEAVYKAWFPLTRRWLGFEEAVITINRFDRTFSAKILTDVPGDPTGFEGRWAVVNGVIATAIAQPVARTTLT